MGQARGAGDAGGARGRGGRSLDGSRDVVLRESALALLAEVGYDRLTMDAVAARAGAAKTTIYRRWRGKAELVVDALDSLKGAPEVPDTGSLRKDLKALAEWIAGAESQFDARITVGMVSALARDGELRRVFGEKFLALQQFAMSGELPGTGFASRVMDEVIYPLATAPPARTRECPDAGAGL